MRISCAPHIRQTDTTQSIMRDVIIALLPTAIAGVAFFGANSLMLLAVSIASAVLAEFLFQKITKRPVRFYDFSAIVTGSDVENKKPAPDIYLEGARRLGLKPEDCLVVEDAINGIHAAHAAGMDAVGIPSTFSREELQEQGNPEYILDQATLLTGLPELN